MRSNCLSYWFPKLVEAGIPVPKTRIVETDVRLVMIDDGEIPPGYYEFLEELRGAVLDIGLPCFLRTGHTSGKHYWEDTCGLTDIEALPQHVFSLVEFSECCDFIGLPYNVWVAREMLPVESLGVAYKGMPVVKEFRWFVDGGEVLCFHPYWPRDTLPEISDAVYSGMLDVPAKDYAAMRALAVAVGEAVGGRWSVDLLPTENGWYVTDLATMATSYHWPGCENGPQEDEVLEGFEHLFEDKE